MERDPFITTRGADGRIPKLDHEDEIITSAPVFDSTGFGRARIMMMIQSSTTKVNKQKNYLHIS